jgi:HK97 family phage major capsid protein
VNNNKTVAEANFIDILGYAKTQLRLNNYVANRILMNPADYYSLMFVVDNDGDYLMNTPNWQYVANLIVQTNYVTEGNFYVFDSRANTIFQRENVNVEFSYEDRDNFQKNLVTIRAEERIVQVTDRPNGIVYGDFDSAVAS